MDYGLLSGLAEGIKQGTASYQDARRNRLAEEQALDERKARVTRDAQDQQFKEKTLLHQENTLKQNETLEREKMQNAIKLKSMETSRRNFMDPKEALAYSKALKDQQDPYNQLPKAGQLIADEEIKTYSKRQGAVDKLGGALAQLKDPKLPDDQKVVIGQGVLKLLNDPEMSDAIGVDEAKRIGAYLETWSLTRPGSTFGRDLPRFTSQVQNKLDLVKRIQGESGQRLSQKGLLQTGADVAQAPRDQQIDSFAKANGLSYEQANQLVESRKMKAVAPRPGANNGG